ncbi:hypothetical protein GUJ93_ZPchr0005g15787 [Zizania palustris]|uniref:Uncharacterized protein n=1 Tax=Zizania palustris TaxID=103762 RepID=A0A8J5S9G7_ZIZPA|nr:hypothetical protein GUJ93_ZPchr0005g15787 [Zizania palustris]
MSDRSVANDNSGKKDDNPIITIINRLAAIEDMMRPLVPPADQVAAIETTMTGQGKQQQLLSAGLLRVKRSLSTGRSPSGGRVAA